jgi:hypothetical protein
MQAKEQDRSEANVEQMLQEFSQTRTAPGALT